MNSLHWHRYHRRIERMPKPRSVRFTEAFLLTLIAVGIGYIMLFKV